MSPSFTIVVPTFNRPRQLTACLDALTKLEYPRERWEVIVVDDASPEPPRNVIAAYCNRLRVSLLIQSHSGPACARNRGVEQASGELIAFTDDDCAPTPGIG